MKTVYLANKAKPGSMFTGTYNSLQELKQAIYDHFDHLAYGYEYSLEWNENSEKIVKECIKEHMLFLYEVELHDDEKIIRDYHGFFTVVKKPEFILSTADRIHL